MTCVVLGPTSHADDTNEEWIFESFGDDPADIPSAENELSRKPSTMSSSSGSSKRGHDEVELDEEEGGYSPRSPGMLFAPSNNALNLTLVLQTSKRRAYNDAEG